MLTRTNLMVSGGIVGGLVSLSTWTKGIMGASLTSGIIYKVYNVLNEREQVDNSRYNRVAIMTASALALEAISIYGSSSFFCEGFYPSLSCEISKLTIGATSIVSLIGFIGLLYKL